MTKPPSPKPMPTTTMPDVCDYSAHDMKLKEGAKKTAGGSLNINPGKEGNG